MSRCGGRSWRICWCKEFVNLFFFLPPSLYIYIYISNFKDSIKRDTFLSPSYEPEGYAELPKYEWNTKFKARDYANTIREYNTHLYHQMKNQHSIHLNHIPPDAFEGTSSPSSPSSPSSSPLSNKQQTTSPAAPSALPTA